MPGEFPFFIVGKVVDTTMSQIVLVRVINGNVYHLIPSTPGIKFEELKRDQLIELEVTTMLVRVLSARIIED